MDSDTISTFAIFAACGGVAMVVAIFAAIRDRRHHRRTDRDRISIVPWGLVSVLFSIAAIVLLATASKIYFAGA